MSEKVTAMIEEIKGLTVLELSELVHALEEEFGVSAAAMAAPAAGAAAPAAEEKTDFNVVLTGFDAAQKIKVIKVIREVMGLGLAEAKAAVEGAPTDVYKRQHRTICGDAAEMDGTGRRHRTGGRDHRVPVPHRRGHRHAGASGPSVGAVPDAGGGPCHRGAVSAHQNGGKGYQRHHRLRPLW